MRIQFRLACLVILGVLAAEALDASGSIDQLLLAREERVAVGTDFYVDVAVVRGTRSEAVATGTDNIDVVVIRMDSSFRHFKNSFYKNQEGLRNS